MGQALYRKYRSRSFDEVVGQEPITETLKKAIKSGKISHAYLFSGPRGVGKTSVARIFAHEVNGIKYVDESLNLDIIEIDAASNRRIDEVRDLREKVHVAPALLSYKVYIIDEVHMLTREAFNALLKTLEEPPRHVIFILATTEAHKLPDTIVSRTQRFSFKPIEESAAVAHLQKIAKKEGIDVDVESLKLMVDHAEGSIRDSIGMLDQIAGLGRPIRAKDVHLLLGLPSADVIEHLLEKVEKGQPAQVVLSLEQLSQQGANPSLVASQISQALRRQILQQNKSQDWQLNLLKQLLFVPSSPRPNEYLEISLLEVATSKHTDDSSSVRKSVDYAPKAELAIRQPSQVAKPVGEAKQAALREFDLAKWLVVLDRIKLEAASLYTALKLAEPRIEGEKLVLAFQFPLHQKKINQAHHLKMVEAVIDDVMGVRLIIKCIIDKKASAGQAPVKTAVDETEPTSQTGSNFSTINNIFGAAEMLES